MHETKRNTHKILTNGTTIFNVINKAYIRSEMINYQIYSKHYTVLCPVHQIFKQLFIFESRPINQKSQVAPVMLLSFLISMT